MNIIETLTPFIQIILTLIVLALVYVSIKIAKYVINHMKRFEYNLTFTYLLSDLIKYTIYIIGIIIIFDIFSIDLKGIFVSLGIAGIAAGFAAEDIISTVLAWFFILLDQSLKVGDVMEVNGTKGIIQKIGFRNTTVMRDDGTTVFIPNSALSKTSYIRFKDKEDVKIRLQACIPFEIDLTLFEKEIIENINKNPWVLKTPPSKINSKEIVEEGTVLKIFVWIEDYNKKEEYKLIITNQIHEYIGKKLGE